MLPNGVKIWWRCWRRWPVVLYPRSALHIYVASYLSFLHQVSAYLCSATCTCYHRVSLQAIRLLQHCTERFFTFPHRPKRPYLLHKVMYPYFEPLCTLRERTQRRAKREKSESACNVLESPSSKIPPPPLYCPDLLIASVLSIERPCDRDRVCSHDQDIQARMGCKLDLPRGWER